ncbi:biotin--[acetyl-CoA-carboxylase] ligase [Nitrososphaera viennensis]|uniref:Biotin-[acetyl-CoA-carboxylase] ligase n=2 Tax=Nitrososphaera viennensis TaxID=1034015 RepID=A0A060HGX3_9ARCH|nr:biotin--[acetyl-CoA-carboxylase] ligase [Nitrososphaera viennensis]AIC14818.1 biotin-[acetyl-CoA-carboxylase] ligase [Nitrososphaera viennensis EN76]UVS69771.1 biotin--[acetyl-CoA-carboxylase] ligase [Nitrososphaera viennensis]
MTTRAAQDQYRRLEEFLELLKKSPDFASGQSLAKRAGISRSAVWKQVRRLRQCGYSIESLHGMGYRLASGTTHPVPWELGRILKTSFVGKGRIVYRDSADSTQNIAIALAEKHEDVHGAVAIAEQQNSGRGRMKRRWLSPRGGVWLSVVLKPSIPTAASTMLPFVAALAVCDAVRQRTGLLATLKWPNDVMVGGKKAAGILLDLSAEAETVNYAVIGIGINANVDTSRMKIDDREGRPAITSLKEELGGRDVNRLELARLLLENLERFYGMLESGGGPEKIVAEWRRRSDMLGKKVSVVQAQQGKKAAAVEGVAADINDDGSLLLKTKSGDVNVVSGDVHVSY